MAGNQSPRHWLEGVVSDACDRHVARQDACGLVEILSRVVKTQGKAEPAEAVCTLVISVLSNSCAVALHTLAWAAPAATYARCFLHCGLHSL
eukprot:6260557-Amphidinium_carterae.3